MSMKNLQSSPQQGELTAVLKLIALGAEKRQQSRGLDVNDQRVPQRGVRQRQAHK